MAEWIMRLSSKREVPGSNHTVGKNFSFCNSCTAQLDNADANEINRGIYLANTLF